MLSYSIYDRTRHGMVLAILGAMACGHALGASTADHIRQALQSGQLEQASRLVQQEKQLNPRDVQIRFLEGVVLAQLGQTDKAIESFGKLVESNPEIVEAHNNLGVLYASKGRLEDARKALEAGMQAHAGYATLHRNLGDVQSQLTRQTYAKALQVDSKSRQAVPQLSLLGSMGGPLPAQAMTPSAPSTPVTPPPGLRPRRGRAPIRAAGRAPNHATGCAACNAPGTTHPVRITSTGQDSRAQQGRGTGRTAPASGPHRYRRGRRDPPCRAGLGESLEPQGHGPLPGRLRAELLAA